MTTDNTATRNQLQNNAEQPRHNRYLSQFRVRQCQDISSGGGGGGGHGACRNYKPNYTCFNYHLKGQKRRKVALDRDGSFTYSPHIYCTKYNPDSGTCPDETKCKFLHHNYQDTERKFHPRFYKTSICPYEIVKCSDNRLLCRYEKDRGHCPYAHGPSDLRNPVIDQREELTKGQRALPDEAFPQPLDKERNEINENPQWANRDYILQRYKTQACKKSTAGSRSCRQGFACPLFHNAKDKRRSPYAHTYRSTPCPQVKGSDDWGEPGLCSQGDNCGYCHTRVEQQFHPDIYKTTKCHDYQNTSSCPRGVYCAFAHQENTGANLPSSQSLGELSTRLKHAVNLNGEQPLSSSTPRDQNNNNPESDSAAMAGAAAGTAQLQPGGGTGQLVGTAGEGGTAGAREGLAAGSFSPPPPPGPPIPTWSSPVHTLVSSNNSFGVVGASSKSATSDGNAVPSNLAKQQVRSGGGGGKSGSGNIWHNHQLFSDSRAGSTPSPPVGGPGPGPAPNQSFGSTSLNNDVENGGGLALAAPVTAPIPMTAAPTGLVDSTRNTRTPEVSFVGSPLLFEHPFGPPSNMGGGGSGSNSGFDLFGERCPSTGEGGNDMDSSFDGGRSGPGSVSGMGGSGGGGGGGGSGNDPNSSHSSTHNSSLFSGGGGGGGGNLIGPGAPGSAFGGSFTSSQHVVGQMGMVNSKPSQPVNIPSRAHLDTRLGRVMNDDDQFYNLNRNSFGCSPSSQSPLSQSHPSSFDGSLASREDLREGTLRYDTGSVGGSGSGSGFYPPMQTGGVNTGGSSVGSYGGTPFQPRMALHAIQEADVHGLPLDELISIRSVLTKDINMIEQLIRCREEVLCVVCHLKEGCMKLQPCGCVLVCEACARSATHCPNCNTQIDDYQGLVISNLAIAQ